MDSAARDPVASSQMLPGRTARPATAPPPGEPPSSHRCELSEFADGGGTDGRAELLPEIGDPGQYRLILQLEGSCAVQLGRTQVVLSSDDSLLIAAGRSVRCKVFGRSRQLCLSVPCPGAEDWRLAQGLPLIGVIRGGSGIGMALRSLLLAMRNLPETMTSAERFAVATAARELALSALDATATHGPDLTAPKAALPRHLAPLTNTIERWLADPGLCPSRVAAAHGISTRQLHRWFKQGGTSFSEFVRRRRLEHCRDDLANPRLRSLPMTEIAFRWGFSDSSHFSRCFRAAFGCTARDFRAGRGPKFGDTSAHS